MIFRLRWGCCTGHDVCCKGFWGRRVYFWGHWVTVGRGVAVSCSEIRKMIQFLGWGGFLSRWRIFKGKLVLWWWCRWWVGACVDFDVRVGFQGVVVKDVRTFEWIDLINVLNINITCFLHVNLSVSTNGRSIKSIKSNKSIKYNKFKNMI